MIILMFSSRMKWPIGSLALLLPGVVGLIGVFLVRLPAINSQASSDIVFIVFSASVLLAAIIPATFIMSTPAPLPRRIAFTVATWCLLFLEVWAVVVWSLKGVH
jgi:hypothetical protein